MTECNYIYKLNTKNDECWTERYAVEPLLKYLEVFRDKIIWCPFDTEESEYVKIFQENNYKVIYSHIWNGQDFYNYEPKKWDLIISNPPFSNKRNMFERVLSFKKPFALLMTITLLNDTIATDLFKDKELQLLLFDRRMQFRNENKKDKINFSSGYFCQNFLPRQIIFEELIINGKGRRKRKCQN